LSAADIGEAGSGKLFGEAFVVPHPEMAGSTEEGGGQGFEPAGEGGFAEEAVLHKAGGGTGCWVVVVDVDELFEIGQNHAEGSTGTKIGLDVSDCETELAEGHVLEDVRAVDGFG
jgi:hypothetical protein